MLVLFFTESFLKQKSKNKSLFFYGFLALGVLTIYFKFPEKDLSPATSQSNIQLIKKAGLEWEKWSKNKTQKYQERKLPTFIDFTADWCLTCKVNEKLIIDSKDFRQLIKENNISLLLGDWTNGDQEITDWLLKQNTRPVFPHIFL